LGKFNARKYLEKYTESWKNEGVKYRNIKFFLKETPKEIIDYANKWMNWISTEVWKGIQNGTITEQDILDDKNLEKILQNKWRIILNTGISYWERSLIRPVLKRYKSGIQRNGKFPKSKIRFRAEKAVWFYDKIFQRKDGYLEIRLPGDKKDTLKIDYNIPGTMSKKIPYLTKGLSGNLIDGKMYIARTKEPIKWKYEPKDVVGIDLGKRPEVFCYWSNGTIISQSVQLIQLIREMKLLNSEINNKKKKDKDGNKIIGALNTKQRKRRRLRLKKMHKQQQKMIDVYVKELIDYAEKNELMVAVDDAKTGTQNGSYGQDKFIDDAIKYLENKNIPHVLVPSPHTSEMCHKCNANCVRDKDFKETTCPNCGKMNADFNGAKNVARFGWKMWNEGTKKFYTWKKSVRSTTKP
jgi:transposase